MNGLNIKKIVISSSLLLGMISSPLLCSAAENDKIYRSFDDKGRPIFTNQNMQWNDKYVHIEFVSWKGWHEVKAYSNWRDNRERFQSMISRASTEFNVPASLINAVIHTESYFNPDVQSKAGAVGLMQLMPATASRFGVSDRWNPKDNIRGGTRFLSYLLNKYDNNLVLTLAAYNAGEGAVKKYGNAIPPYPETQNYVKKALAFLDNYREGLAAN